MDIRKRFNPFDRKVSRNLRNHMGGKSREYFGNPGYSANFRGGQIDLSEHDNHYLIEAKMPEVDVQNVNIQVKGYNLIIQGQKRRNIMERRNGTFRHSVTLPEDSDVDEISVARGIDELHIKIPKKVS